MYVSKRFVLFRVFTLRGSALVLTKRQLVVIKSMESWASLVAQRLRIHLAMQGTQVQYLVQEDRTSSCEGNSEHVSQLLSLCSRTFMPQLLSLRAATAEHPGAQSLCSMQEKPPAHCN